jgi:hypothetical protein
VGGLIQGAGGVQSQLALCTAFRKQGPSCRAIPLLKRAVANHLRVKAAVTRVVNLLEEDTVQAGAYLRAGPVYVHGEGRGRRILRFRNGQDGQRRECAKGCKKAISMKTHFDFLMDDRDVNTDIITSLFFCTSWWLIPAINRTSKAINRRGRRERRGRIEKMKIF